MPIPKSLKSLTKLFAKLGARNPDAWAKSQVEEGINQLHRFLFLRQAWERVVAEDDHSWMDEQIYESQKDSSQPFSSNGIALQRLLAVGACKSDITDLVRGMQAQLLVQLCYLLENPCLDEEEVEDIGWSLVETDAELEPTGARVGGLHESALGMDPTGREMRPRG